MSAYSIASRGLAGRKVPQGTLTPMGELLFSASEQGAWYDPSDMSTLFQDSAGTTPVTGVEQPVGLMLDKRLGLVRGVEKVANGGFDTSAGWTLGTGWSIGGGVATFDPTGQAANSDAYASLSSASDSAATYDIAVNGAFRVMLPISAGGIVEISGTVLNRTAGALRVLSAVGRIYIRALNGTGFNGSVENISVRELPGNHASQATSTKRPKYSRRVNLLTKTEQFDDAVWVVNTLGGANCTKTANATVAPNGTLTADLITSTGLVNDFIYQAPPLASGSAVTLSLYVKNHDTASISVQARTSVTSLAATINWTGSVLSSITLTTGTSASFVDVGSGWYRVSLSFTTGEANQFMRVFPGVGKSIYVWGASLTLGIDSHLPYQRVNTPTDYDADPNKFPAYLACDGIDDALQTGNIDFTGTDKMTVWAGVTKLSDAATAVVTEFGNFATPLNGAFLLAAPASAAPNIGFTSRGTSNAAANVAGYPAPLSTVATGVGSISTDESVFRLNGVQVVTSSSDQGTGNYSNYPMYIGARAGTSLFFNGRLYSLIVRGAATPLPQIEVVETLIRQKMRLP